MTQPVWTLTDKEKIKKTLELIQDFENSGSSKHYKANAQKMRIMRWVQFFCLMRPITPSDRGRG